MSCKITFLFLLFSSFSFAQIYESTDKTLFERKHNDDFSRFTHFEISTPLKANPNRGQENYTDQESQYWYLPDGLNAKFGYGLNYLEAIGVSLHSGIEWNISDQLFVAPVFANLNFSPFVSETLKISLQAGYGKAFVLGRGNLQGTYRRFALGFETDEGFGLFAELTQYRFTYKDNDGISNLSLGVSYRMF